MSKYFSTILLLAVALLTSLSASADTDTNAMLVLGKDGNVTAFEFAAKLVVTFQGDQLTVTTSSVSLFDFEDVRKIYFGNHVPSAIKTPTASRPSFFFNGDIVTISGLSDGKVSVFSLSGIKMPVNASSSNGTVSFSIASLPSGIYIIRTNAQTFKINKR